MIYRYCPNCGRIWTEKECEWQAWKPFEKVLCPDCYVDTKPLTCPDQFVEVMIVYQQAQAEMWKNLKDGLR